MMTYLLLANLYLAVFYTVYHFFLRKETFFRLNRYYLLASLVLSFSLPLANVPLAGQYGTQLAEQLSAQIKGEPAGESGELFLTGLQPSEEMLYQNINIPDQASVSLSGDVVTLSDTTSFSGKSFHIRHLYLLGCIVSFLFLLFRIWHTWVAFSNHKKQRAFSFFNLVCVSKDIEGYDNILQHENVHAREWHSLDILLVQIIRVFNWFNPFVYALERSFKLQHEYHADSLASGRNQVSYAELLLATALQISPQSLNNQFSNPSLLKSRIIMLLKNKTPKHNLVKYMVMLPVIIGMVIVSSACNPSSQSTQEEEDTIDTEVIAENESGVTDTADGELLQDSTQLVIPPPVEPPPPTRRNNNSEVEPPVMKDGADPNPIRVDARPDQVRMPEFKVAPAKKADTSKSNQSEAKAVSGKVTRIDLPDNEETPLFLEGAVEILPMPHNDEFRTINEFRTWFMQNFKIPQEASEANFSGPINIIYVVDENGKLTNIEVPEDPGYGLTEAVIEVLERSPKWKPGIQNGKAVRTKMTLPLRINLKLN